MTASIYRKIPLFSSSNAAVSIKAIRLGGTSAAGVCVGAVAGLPGVGVVVGLVEAGVGVAAGRTCPATCAALPPRIKQNRTTVLLIVMRYSLGAKTASTKAYAESDWKSAYQMRVPGNILPRCSDVSQTVQSANLWPS